MKKLFYSLFIAAAMVACGDDGDEVVVVVEQSTDIAASSFTLESPEGTTFAWTEGSRLSLFRSNTNERFAYDAAGDVFKKEDKLKMGEPFENAYAVYPYKGTNRVSNGDIKTEVPSAQTYSADGVNFADAPMVGMSATASDPTMELKNLCGVAVVKLYGSAIVKSVAVTGNNGEVLAGTAMAEIGEDGNPTFDIVALQNNTVTLTAEEPVALGATVEEATPFYLLVPPTTFENGFIVTVVDSYGNVRKKNFKVDEANPAVSIDRNEVVTIAEYELAEKKPVQTILDVQFNLDGTAVDEGIYGLDVNLVGEAGEDPFVYKHPKFKDNNIARFNHNCYNNNQEPTGFYKIDYSQNVEMMETIADGFAMEVVFANTAWSWDWWSVPVSTDAFRLMRKGYKDDNAWTFTFNNGGGWWPGNITPINATLELNKYTHVVYMYDADNLKVQVYQDGILLGEANDVAEFASGQWLSIGGTLEMGGNLAMHWNGEVAVVRMYDQALTPDEIATKFNDLKLPEAPIAPATTISTPLLDVKFNENKSATNAGSMASLEVKSAADMGHNMDNTAMINVDGFGWVPQFKTAPHNGDSWDNWYRIDYTDNAEFKGKLEDGFTMEILCFHDGNPGDFYVRPVSTDKWGVHLRCNGGGGYHWWQTFINAGNGYWNQWGDQWNGWGHDNRHPIFNKDTGAVMESYAHYVFVWDAEDGEWGSYLNGNFNGGNKSNTFNYGNVFNICGMPHVNGQAQHGWTGKVAMVRFYDEAFNQEQVISRYTELQPAIQKLNASN